ncbi:S8 family peptidase [Neptunomonas sp.]|uniref:S8 family peptidase n=1 Tax=Neptunomonas sp. TaxID=1971898 RepID=UPI00356425A2
MHNPIQIVLKPNNLIYSPQRDAGGKNTDFYGEQDEEYKSHKNELIEQIASISASLSNNSYSAIGVAKITLKPGALAKSHRPIRALFKPEIAPLLGSGGFGELYFQVSKESINFIKEKIDSTEEITRWKRNPASNKMEFNPSRGRSETGAIDTLSIYSSVEKLSFEAREAINWLEKSSTGKGYLVDLFQYSQPEHKNYQIQATQIESAEQSFLNGLTELGPGLIVTRLSKRGLADGTLHIQLSKSKNDPYINISKPISDRPKSGEVDIREQRHSLLLRFLKNHPIVKKISLPPTISRNENGKISTPNSETFPKPKSNESYPIAGIIDSGVRAEPLKEWCLKQSIGFDVDACDSDHGSQVASLIIGGQSLNNPTLIPEPDGCMVYDIWAPLHSYKNSFSEYFDGIGDFFDWLDIEVENAKTHGVRIFNFSINFHEHVSTTDYSKTATLLDEISTRHDVIFVVSAGNLPPIDQRPKWPKNPGFVAEYIAAYGTNDRICQPADSVKSITVAAINPTGCEENPPGAPTVYSRRGPGVSLGVKPDLAHYGGYANSSKGGSGLVSLSGNGTAVQESGTSFSAPLVTKTLASLDFRTDFGLNRESLTALLIHHSQHPEILQNKKLPKAITRQFVGFGIPNASQDMLVTDDYSISILFTGVLKKGQIAEFNFVWPQSLVNDGGKCKGTAKLTLVYSTQTDARYGSEYCRTNVDASLKQEVLIKGEWKYRKSVNSIWHTQLGNEATYEKTLIEHGLKWWPIKVYERTMTGVGKSANWQLTVNAQLRSNESFPKDGIPFCIVMSISDNQKLSNTVFDEMRRTIQASGIEIGSINTRTEITT